ncbi:hypothetical protein AA16373_2805 [Komagataeibacter swingsii DSM 16373]|nr:hypothetical protein AA16373_2805 [Komagataeibacter swingsii DSM 16373]
MPLRVVGAHCLPAQGNALSMAFRAVKAAMAPLHGPKGRVFLIHAPMLPFLTYCVMSPVPHVRRAGGRGGGSCIPARHAELTHINDAGHKEACYMRQVFESGPIGRVTGSPTRQPQEEAGIP